MAICGSCGHESTRIRTVFPDKEPPRDECPHCNPSRFEKFTAPSDRKIWMGYEAHPNEYERAPDGGWDRKPEYRAEQEEKLRQPTEEEKENLSNSIRKKRAERRTMPMTPAEESAALAKALQYASYIEEVADIVH